VIKNLKIGVILATAYFIAGNYGLLFSFSGAIASPLFPATGIALAAALIYGESMVGWVFVGAFVLILSNFSSAETFRTGLVTSAEISFASALQTYVTLKLIHRYIGKNVLFESFREVISFTLIVLLGCLTSASISTFGLLYGNQIQTENLMFSWFTWWLGDAFGMMLITPLVLTLIGEPRELWHSRRRVTLTVVIVGIVFISVVERVVWQWEKDKNTNNFIMESDQVKEQLLSRFTLEEAFLEQLATLMGGTHQISPQEFENFSKVGVSRFFNKIKAVEWAPLVTRENRNNFEINNKKTVQNYQISERDSEGKIIAARDRENYIPVTYLYPLSGNETAIGYDLSSNLLRNEAINKSRISYQSAATAPITLVQETEKQSGLLLVHWVGNGANGPGLVLIVLRIGDLIDYVTANTKHLISIRLIDEADKKIIYDSINDDSKVILYDQLVSFGQRHYRLQAAPTTNYLREHRNWQTWSITLCGLAFISGLSMTLLLISARTRQVENQAAENEQRWELAASGANDGIWDWNLKTNEAFFSDRFKTMLGYRVEDIKPQIDEWVERVHPDDWNETNLAMKRHFEGDSQFYERELRIRCKNGEYKWILCRGKALIENGEPTRMVGSHTDITARRLAEAAIREQAQQLDEILKLSPDGFISFDDQHIVKYASPSFYRMTGLAQDSVIGASEMSLSKLITDICIPKSRFSGIAVMRTLHLGKKEGSDDSIFRIELIRTKIVLEVGLKEATTGSISQILFFRDITHESEVDRMKSEFLSTAAHELRTPMSSIYGFSELLLAQEFTLDERMEFISTIFEQSKLMVSIINELLDLSRIDARRGKDFILSKFNIATLISEVIAGYIIPHDRISTHFSKGKDLLINICADRKKLHQVLNNILSNAVKFSPNGGAINVELIDSHRLEQPASGTAVHKIGIRIEDHGIGMTPEQVSRIFERFYRADTSGKIPGTGLGLSIVKEIIELHHGSIQVESIFPRGTIVTLWLPVYPIRIYTPHAQSREGLYKVRHKRSRAGEVQL